MALKTTEKTELIVALNQEKLSPFASNLTKLLEIMISDVRTDNDTVPTSDILHNQGKIAALKTLLYYIHKGIPQPVQKG